MRDEDKYHISTVVARHEGRIMRADAEANELPLGKYLLMSWRNWRALGLPLRFIPPYPREPWIHPKDRQADVRMLESKDGDLEEPRSE